MDQTIPGTYRGWPLWLALITLALHLAVNAAGGYGYFRDELYYLACAGHPDIGYVDQPPLSIWILAANRSLFGDSIFALRLLPALAAAVTVFLAGLFARRLGGGTLAQALAALAVAVSPVMLGMCGTYSMNAFDILLWTVAFLLLLDLEQGAQPRTWLALGMVLGLGLLNKISMGWLAAGVAAGIILTPRRQWLKTPWPWLAAFLALLIASPFVLWNFTHQFAHLEFARRAAQLKYASQNPLTFASGLVLINNPLALPLWLAGFSVLLRDGRFRLVGIALATVVAILLVNFHTKSEYFAAGMMPLFAAGAVAFESFSAPARRRWLRPVYLTLVGLAGVIFLPLTLPVLPPEGFLRYEQVLSVQPPSTEAHQLAGLPQHYADCFGWREMADSVAAVYNRLTPGERQSCTIITDNYGEAGAIDFFGRAKGLPRAMSQHNSYYFWGFNEWRDQRVVIVIDQDAEDLQKIFESVEPAGITSARWAIPYENGRRIWVCRNLRVPFPPVWRSGKHFI